jgi:hypothetical protein
MTMKRKASDISLHVGTGWLIRHWIDAFQVRYLKALLFPTLHFCNFQEVIITWIYVFPQLNSRCKIASGISYVLKE